MRTNMYNDEVWNMKSKEHEEMSAELSAFFTEIEEVCRKHNLSISHEDGHGSFIVEVYEQENLRWLANANRNY